VIAPTDSHQTPLTLALSRFPMRMRSLALRSWSLPPRASWCSGEGGGSSTTPAPLLGGKREINEGCPPVCRSGFESSGLCAFDRTARRSLIGPIPRVSRVRSRSPNFGAVRPADLLAPLNGCEHQDEHISEMVRNHSIRRCRH
jgi:hypothetical protein